MKLTSILITVLATVNTISCLFTGYSPRIYMDEDFVKLDFDEREQLLEDYRNEISRITEDGNLFDFGHLEPYDSEEENLEKITEESMYEYEEADERYGDHLQRAISNNRESYKENKELIAEQIQLLQHMSDLLDSLEM